MDESAACAADLTSEIGQGDEAASQMTIDPTNGLKRQLLNGMDELQNQIIMVNTLKFLTTTELQICAQVCDEWKKIIITKIGVPLFIGRASRCWPSTFNFDEPTILGKIATPFLVISDLTESADEICLIEYPEVCKVVLIDGAISANSFTKLLVNPANLLVNLVEFAIDWTTMNHLPIRQVSLDFPSLKSLRLWTLQPKPAAFLSTTNWTLAKDNILALLEPNFPLLRKLYLHYIPLCQNISSTIVAVVNFISRHKKTLKKLLVDFVGIEKESSDAGENYESLLHNDDLIESCSGVGLTHGFVHTDLNVRGIAPINILNQIVLQCQSLNSIYLDNGLHSTLSKSTVQHNKSTLISIEMDITPLNGFIDCAELHGCCHLQILTLIGRKKRTGNRSDENLPEVIETSLLPQSLLSLRLLRLRINTSNSDYLILKLQNLMMVELQEIGQEGGLGLSFLALNQTLCNPRIQKLSVWRGINLSSICPIQTPNSFSACPLGACLLKQRLDEDGDFKVGLYLETPAGGYPYYSMDWDKDLDTTKLFSFHGIDPKLCFASTPVNLEDYDDDDDEDEEFYDDDEMGEGDSEEEVGVDVDGDDEDVDVDPDEEEDEHMDYEFDSDGDEDDDDG